jgi:hypothetical protein
MADDLMNGYIFSILWHFTVHDRLDSDVRQEQLQRNIQNYLILLSMDFLVGKNNRTGRHCGEEFVMGQDFCIVDHIPLL